jgi:hypothetical protein
MRYDMNGKLKCKEIKTGFCRRRSIQTGSSDTPIGWKSWKTTYVPLWDRMERGYGLWMAEFSAAGAQIQKEFICDLMHKNRFFLTRVQGQL